MLGRSGSGRRARCRRHRGGEGTVLGIWQARADARQLRRLVAPLAYGPVWLPAE